MILPNYIVMPAQAGIQASLKEKKMNNLPILQKQLQTIERFSAGTLGVSALHIETHNAVNFNEEARFLMCSTYKVPLAIYLLVKVESGEIDLNELCEITEYDLRPGIIGTLNQF